MKHSSILILTFLLLNLNLTGQNRKIKGRVLAEDLEPLPHLQIKGSNDSVLVETSLEGHFEFDITQNTDSLFFHYLGMEKTGIRLSQNCSLIEIIIFYDGLYHYGSFDRIDRDRKRRFKDLADLHLKAVKEGLFESNNVCYERTFVPIKPELERIEKDLKELRKENLNHYKNLQVGDIVKIPLGFDSSGKIVNTRYSICGDCTEDDYEYVLKGEIINKLRRHLTLELKVLKMLPYDSFEYEGQTLTVGDTFKYQMKYFNVIIN